ncbi:D-glycero-beta-D-manno-heptose-7-phosphate kinase [Commensalibacter oyaizuii]|uniref:Bifunctional protein HldE n=1 Tax=Commensalibacter oyaizuii TaxID=3043873 RepID=A0ABT6Q234_9PROT|nr:D-glycero-beta-D-manno-heptose-7-phosphate kinase [Commensalibacter sp. TBRC 16381]MDI2091171.1 D-glycero-beta-D-manno-heptose-7-phosphate kinase [Commensalibacter sp. TBRC 16381]
MDFSNITVLCLGDVMLDRFIYANVQRISPEAPVPVLQLNNKKEMLGGAGNVTSNILSLGGKSILIGLVGHDEYASTIHALMRKKNITSDFLVQSRYRPTICKSRFIAANQQVIRADEESLLPLTHEEITGIKHSIDKAIPLTNAVIISDYGKGVCHPEILEHIIQLAKNCDIPVFVDPKSSDFSLYQYATCVTPNIKEASEAVKHPLENDEDFAQAGQTLLDITKGQAILITRSEKGMTLVEHGKTVETIPSRAREVFDVSGAGDTVIATLTLSYAAGYTLSEAMHIANAAAGVVVAKAGTSTATIAEVLTELQAQKNNNLPELMAPHLISLSDLQQQVQKWKKQGLTVGFTNGCFDIIHPGHVSLLKFAREHCDRLVVALNTDRSIQALKGSQRPINILESRASVIAALRYVDAVIAFDEDTPLTLISHLKPNILIKGGDYLHKDVVGKDIVEQNGGKVILADLQEGFSTTNIIDKITKN